MITAYNPPKISTTDSELGSEVARDFRKRENPFYSPFSRIRHQKTTALPLIPPATQATIYKKLTLLYTYPRADIF